MKLKKQRGLTPQLRFPEFRDAGAWEEKRLEDVFDFYSTANNPRADLSNEGDTFYIHYGDIHTKFHSYVDFSKDAIPKIASSLYRNATFLENGDLIVADASEDTEGVAKTVEVRGLNDGVKAISGLHTILLRDSRKQYVDGFRGLLREIEKVKKQIQRLAVGVKVYAVSKTILRQVRLPLPSPAEQQKIADCLTFLDDLIAAQSHKLAALRAYKKGLLQQLFPAEGETLPRLRFPEFQDAGEWEDLPLGEVGEIVTGKTPSTADSALWNGEIQFVTPTDIKEEKYQYKTQRTVFLTKKLKILPKYSIMFTCIASIGKMALSIFPCITNQQINTLIPKNNFDNEYVYYALLSITDYIKSTQANSTLPIINKTEFSKFLIPVPSKPEQQKIADCLTSLDALIAAQSQKLDALKAHKRGLQQQLFPAPEGDG